MEQIQLDSNTRWDTTNGTVLRRQINQTDAHWPSKLQKCGVLSPKVKAKTCSKGIKLTGSNEITNYLSPRTSVSTKADTDSVTESRGRPPPKPPPVSKVEITAIDGTHSMITTHSIVGKNKLHFKTSYIQQISTTPIVEIGQLPIPISRGEVLPVSNSNKVLHQKSVLHTDTVVPCVSSPSYQSTRYTNRLNKVVQSNHPCLQILENDSEQPNQLIKEYKGHRITLDTFQRLRSGKWLNDEIINYYFQLLQDRELSAWYLSTFKKGELVEIVTLIY